jgi:oligopeptide transport system ATP-binding protein
MIAMALLCEPELLIADEPTTALDVTVQAQILDLLGKLRQETGMAIALITHDLGVIAGLADRVMVMYAGEIAERANAGPLFKTPQHPYTQGLLRSMPRLDESRIDRLQTIGGQPPNLQRLPDGCRFRDRCSYAFDRCAAEKPLLRHVAADRAKACHLEAL